MGTERHFGGVMGPMVTPFRADESVDLEGFAFNVRAHIAAGLDGVLVAGSTGEAALLSDDERRTLTEVARNAVPKERTLLVMGDLPIFTIGLLFSFISAWMCVRWLLRFISTHSFTPFAWYRIAFGLIVLATAWSGQVTWSA